MPINPLSLFQDGSNSTNLLKTKPILFSPLKQLNLKMQMKIKRPLKIFSESLSIKKTLLNNSFLPIKTMISKQTPSNTHQKLMNGSICQSPSITNSKRVNSLLKIKPLTTLFHSLLIETLNSLRRPQLHLIVSMTLFLNCNRI